MTARAAREAWRAVREYLQHAPLTEARKLTQEITDELERLGLTRKGGQS